MKKLWLLALLLPAILWATLSSETSSVQYSGNGSTTSFSYPWRIFEEDELQVVLIQDSSGSRDTQVLTTEYSVTGEGGNTGGNVVFVTAPASGYTVDIRRVIELTQPTSIRNQTRYSSRTHEDVFDRLAMQIQQLDRQLEHAIRTDDVGAAPDFELSGATDREDKFISFDSNGDAELVSALDPTVVLSQSNIGEYLWPQTTAEAAVAVTPTNYFYQEGDVYRYGYTGANGAADISARTDAFAVLVEKSGGTHGPYTAPYIKDGWVILGAPETTIFGTGSDAIQEALDLADDLGMSVYISGIWDELTAQATDPRGWYDTGHTPTRVSDTEFSVSGDQQTFYQAGVPLQIVGDTTGTGVVASTAWSSPTLTVTVTWDAGVTPTNPVTVNATRLAAVYLPAGVSLRGNGRVNTVLKLADAANAQLMVLENTTSTDNRMTLRDFTLNGNGANQTAGGSGALLYIDVTGASGPQNLTLSDIYVSGGFLQCIGVTSNGSDIQGVNVYVHTCGTIDGSTVAAACAVSLGGADNMYVNWDVGQADGCGVAMAGGSSYINFKAWFTGNVDIVNGHCYRVSSGGGHVRFSGWGQDCGANGMNFFSTGTSVHNIIEFISHRAELIAFSLGGNVYNSDFTITAGDVAGGANYTTDYALDLLGTNSGNRVRVYTESGIPYIDPASPNVGNNVVMFADAPVQTFTAADATPSVIGSEKFLTDSGALTITDLEDCYPSQEITIVSKGAVTFDTTGTSLGGSSADLVTAAGDITVWICETEAQLWLKAFVDASADNSGGA